MKLTQQDLEALRLIIREEIEKAMGKSQVVEPKKPDESFADLFFDNSQKVSQRLYNCIIRMPEDYDIWTKKLSQITDDDLLSIPGFGRMMLQEFKTLRGY